MDEDDYTLAVCPDCGPVIACVTTVSIVVGARQVIDQRVARIECPDCDKRLGP